MCIDQDVYDFFFLFSALGGQEQLVGKVQVTCASASFISHDICIRRRRPPFPQRAS